MYLNVSESERETDRKETTTKCRMGSSKVLFKIFKKRSEMECPETV